MDLLPSILAQTRGSSADIGAQASAFLDLLFTPAGVALAVLGAAAIAVLLVSRSGTLLVAGLMVFLLSMMRTDSRWSNNILIPPLETLRSFSRPLALALLVILAIRSLGFARGHRRSMLILPAALFFAYELVFIGMIGAFVDPIRGIFGIVCYLAALVAFTFGFPALLRDEEDSDAVLKIFGIAGLMFIAANLIQLAGGYYSAVVQGRFTGISGNAQQMALTTNLFLAVGCYFFSTARVGSWTKWLAGVSLGILGLFILWSGSRTGAVCAVVVVLAFFRTRLGKLALLGIVGGGAFAVSITLFSESLEIVERFLRGGDTRSEVWASAIADFVDSPVYGQIPKTGDEGLNFAESTYLRTLAQMGALGGLLLVSVVMAWIACAVRVWRMGRAVPSLAGHADFFVSATAFFLIASIGEGLLMGVLTLFLPFIYAVFAEGAFVLDAGQRELEWREEQEYEAEAERDTEQDAEAWATAAAEQPQPPARSV